MKIIINLIFAYQVLALPQEFGILVGDLIDFVGQPSLITSLVCWTEGVKGISLTKNCTKKPLFILFSEESFEFIKSINNNENAFFMINVSPATIENFPSDLINEHYYFIIVDLSCENASRLLREVRMRTISGIYFRWARL